MKGKSGFHVDFIGVGAPKCGTSTMADLLADHPDIWLHPNKELNYFSEHHRIHGPLNKEYEQGGIKGYKELFLRQSPNWTKKIGEFSVFYLHDEQAAKRIKKHFPNVNIIIMLREPVAKTYSLYNMNRYFFKDTKLGFKEAVEKHPRYVKEGKYYRQVKQYLELFPGQVKIILLEQFKREPGKTLKEIYKFLGVKSSYVPPALHEKKNVAKKIRYRSVKRATGIIPAISIAMKRARLYFIVDILRKAGLERAMLHIANKWNTEPLKAKPISPAMKSKLFKTFKADVHQLNKLLREKGLVQEDLNKLWGYDNIRR